MGGMSTRGLVHEVTIHWECIQYDLGDWMLVCTNITAWLVASLNLELLHTLNGHIEAGFCD